LPTEWKRKIDGQTRRIEFCFDNASKPVTDFTLHERHTETISFRFGNHRSTPFAPGKSEAIISNIPPDVYLALNTCA
jgi:hypothetical protein